MRLSLGYPPLADEAQMLTEQTSDPPLEGLEPVTTAEEAMALADEAKAIYVEESVNRYVVALLRQTRSDGRLYLGASPRSGIALLRGANALALADGREFLVPDDVKAIAPAVLAHRLILAPEARSVVLFAGASVRLAKKPMRLLRTTSVREQLEGEDLRVHVELRPESQILLTSVVLVEEVGRIGERHVPLRRADGRLYGSYALRSLPRGRYPF